MLTFQQQPVLAQPFAHVIANDFLPADLYADLVKSFPVCPPASGPTGFSYFRGDEPYDALIATHEAWTELYESVQSQRFVDYCLAQFSGTWSAGGCTLDLCRARYVDYVESRADKERRHIRNAEHDSEALWVRLDILQAQIGYKRGAHLDHRRRLLTMLIYFCDSAENQMDGGELLLHRPLVMGGRKLLFEQTRLAPKHNEMVAFACTPGSFHSVSEIKGQLAPRNFVQITVSSSVDAWPE